MPSNLVHTKTQEKHWNMAKERAKDEGKEGNWAYTTAIFEKMSGKKPHEPKSESKHDPKGEKGESKRDKVSELAAAARARLKGV